MTYDQLLNNCFDLILSDEGESLVQTKIDGMLAQSEHKDKVLDALANLFTASENKL